MMRSLTSVTLLAVAVSLLLAASAQAVTISGTAVRDDQGTAWQECSTGTANVSIAVGSTKVATVSCSAANGSFSATGITIPSAGSLVSVYFDGALTQGVAYAKTASTSGDVTGLVVMQDDVSIRHENPGATVTDTDLQAWDSNHDPDIPYDSSTWPTATDTGVGIHVRGGNFQPSNRGLSTEAIDVLSGATMTAPASRALYLRGSGTGGCEFGTGVQRPLCVRTGGVLAKANDDSGPTFRGTGTFAVEAGFTYGNLNIEGGPNSLAILGTGPGQTLTVNYRLTIASPVTTDPWGPDVTVMPTLASPYWGGLHMNTGSLWTGAMPFVMDVAGGSFGITGRFDVPSATVVYRGISAYSQIGTGGTSPNRFGSFDLRSDYTRGASGALATPGYSSTLSSGAALDEPIGTVPFSSGNELITAYNTPTGDIALVKFRTSSSALARTIDMDWDDQDANATDDDGNGVLLIDSGGLDRGSEITVNTGGGCTGVLVSGSAGGNMAAWALCQSDGSFDASLDEDGFLVADAGGTDTAHFTQRNTGFVTLAGDGGAAHGFQVLNVDTATDTITSQISWQAGGAATYAAAACTGWASPSPYIWLVGRTGAPGSEDWAVRRTDVGNATWATTGHTWNAGNGTETATGCIDIASSSIRVVGYTDNGTDDDAVATVATSSGFTGGWGPGGSLVVDGAGDQRFEGVLSTLDAGDTMFGRDNGAAAIWHTTHEGALDTSYGIDGVLHLDTGVGVDHAAAGARIDSPEYQPYVLTLGVPSGGGDVQLAFVDTNGDVLDAQPGRTRFRVRAGGFQVTEDMTVGEGLVDGSAVILDQTTIDSDGTVDVRGDMHVQSDAWFNTAFVKPNTFGGSLLVDGRLQSRAGALRMRPRRPVVDLRITSGDPIEHLDVAGSDATVRVDPSAPVQVLSHLGLRGSSCARPLHVASTTPGSPFTLDVDGAATTTLTNLRVSDSTAAPTPLASTSGQSGGGTTGWTLSGCATTAPGTPPQDLEVDGTRHATQVGNVAPTLSWINEQAPSVTRADVEVYASTLEDVVGLWHLDGGATDSSGNGHALTASGSVAWGAGAFGQAATIGATTSDRLSLPDTPALHLAEYTIDARVRIDPAATSATQTIVSRCNGTNCNFNLYVNNTTDQLVGSYTRQVGGSTTLSTSSSPIVDGTWHHVAFSVSATHAQLYVDGALVSETVLNGQDPLQPTAELRIGTALEGDIDDVRILGRASTTA